MRRYTGLVSLLLLWSALAGAETAYVTDILQLGIHRAPDTSDRPFRNLISGTELEILEQVPRYARVRTIDGEEGWVRSAYLVTEKPAQLSVAELEAEIAELNARLVSVAAGRSNAEGADGGLTERLSAGTGTGSVDPIQDTLAGLKSENESYEARLEAYRGAVPLPWVGAALALALLGGFVAGLWCLDTFIRKRHGGFRVW
ncbi:TIGR04211 family SH3 domain-containing protein [Candidatus Rariloculus sp.]|uniref:TIGR04211 family SH3 domain-containing protein n=1 Tax=Candidatus Rariloculus sp. TaxID=3101265 RepID=UPI003D11DE38